MFTIQKDLNGIFWHIYNNARTRVNVSDFDVVIDDVSNTFIIQCKNGSNIPNQAISISLIQVIDLSVGTSPILFSGANGLIQLLTAKGYTPYLQVPPSVSVVVYRVGQVGVFTMTPTQFTDNFTETGLGTNTMLGWALRNGNNGTKNQQGKFSLNKGVSPYDVIGTLGGSANSVLIGHDHESAVFSNGRKGVNDTGTGGTFNGNVLVEAEANQKIVKTSIKGQSNTGADVPSEDGVGKNMPPYLIDVWVERVTELVINSGSGGGGVESVAGTTVDNTDPLNPVINVPTMAQVLTVGDRVLDIPGTRNFQIDDRTKYLLSFGGETLTLNESVIDFPANSLLQFRALDEGVSLAVVGTLCFYLDGTLPITSLNLYAGDYCELKKISSGNWVLTVSSGAINAIERGVFSGSFSLNNATRGGEYLPLTQTGALTLSIGASAVNGGIDTVLLTANGSAISGFSTWKKLSSDSISTTAATVMFIMVRQYQGVIYYTVNIIT